MKGKSVLKIKREKSVCVCRGVLRREGMEKRTTYFNAFLPLLSSFPNTLSSVLSKRAHGSVGLRSWIFYAMRSALVLFTWPPLSFLYTSNKKIVKLELVHIIDARWSTANWSLSHRRWSGFVHWLSLHGGLASLFLSVFICLFLCLPLALCSSLYRKTSKKALLHWARRWGAYH